MRVTSSFDIVRLKLKKKSLNFPLSASVCLPTCTLAVWTRARRVENFSLVSLTGPSPLNKTPNKIYCEFDCLIIYLPNHFFLFHNVKSG